MTEELLDQLRLGDQAAFEAIFRAYHGRVFATAYGLLGTAQEAEDVAQEVFLRLYIRPLPAGRKHNLLGWLLRVTTNLAYNALRGSRRRRAREDRTTARTEPEAGQVPGDPEAAAVTAFAVRDTLAELPERQVQLLLLRQAGLSYAELAQALGVAEGSVGTLLARAEQAFRKQYERRTR